MNLQFMLFLLVWAGLSAHSFSSILPPTLEKVGADRTGRVTAHIVCVVLAILLGLLLPLRWIWGWFRGEDQE